MVASVSSIKYVVLSLRDLLVKVKVFDSVEIVTPSIVTTPALERAIVVSVAWPNSILPTPKAVVVDAVIPLTGNPVALVSVNEVGVPKFGVTRVGLVAKTNAPEPVSSEITPANSAEVVAANVLNLLLVRATVPVASGMVRVRVVPVVMPLA